MLVLTVKPDRHYVDFEIDGERVARITNLDNCKIHLGIEAHEVIQITRSDAKIRTPQGKDVHHVS